MQRCLVLPLPLWQALAAKEDAVIAQILLEVVQLELEKVGSAIAVFVGQLMCHACAGVRAPQIYGKLAMFEELDELLRRQASDATGSQ